MQTINFYLDEYKPKPLSFDIRFASVLIAVTFILLLIVGVVQTNQVNKLNDIHNEKQKALNILQTTVLSMQKDLAASKKVETLDSQIENAELTLNSYRKIISQIGSDGDLEAQNYSVIFQHLSEQSINQLWLTKIEISHQLLSLQGTAIQSELIPDYVDRLKNAPTLKRYFDELMVERDQDNGNIVNFSLNNGRLVDAK